MLVSNFMADWLIILPFPHEVLAGNWTTRCSGFSDATDELNLRITCHTMIRDLAVLMMIRCVVVKGMKT